MIFFSVFRFRSIIEVLPNIFIHIKLSVYEMNKRQNLTCTVSFLLYSAGQHDLPNIVLSHLWHHKALRLLWTFFWQQNIWSKIKEKKYCHLINKKRKEKERVGVHIMLICTTWTLWRIKTNNFCFDLQNDNQILLI